MSRCFRVIPSLLIILVILVANLVSSFPFTSVVQASTGEFGFNDLTDSAELIIVGTVLDRISYWNDDHTGIFTTVVLSGDEVLKGKLDQKNVAVTYSGGEADGIGQWVSEMPTFDPGEKAVVFLKKLSKEQVPKANVLVEQLSEEQFEVYGGSRGKFSVVGDKVGDLPVTEFKERVNQALNGHGALVKELDLPPPSDTFQYTYAGYCWPHPPSPMVNYRINENTADCTGEGAAVQAAAATWSAAGAYFSFTYAGTTSATASSYDGVNEIFWGNLGSGDTLALTTTWYIVSTLTIVECDMEFNDYYTWSTSGQYDVQTVALHEFGHFLCLDHSSDINAVMYYQYQGIRRALHADDIAGIKSIYGAPANAPTLTNSSGASNIAQTSARLNGEVTSTGGENPTVHIYWGPSDGGTTPGNWAHDANLGVKAAGTFFSDISGLTAGTTYYYRCYAINSGGSNWAAGTTSFTTSPTAPTVNDSGADNIASTSARLNGEVTSTGGENPTVHIYWGPSDGGTTPGNWANDANLGVKAAGTFYTDISSLTAGTTYYYRCYAVNSGGGSWAAGTTSFTTLKLLVSIAITPDSISIALGRTQQFTAIGMYSDTSTANLTGSVTWISDNTSIVAIVVNTGLAQSLMEGQVTITATSGAVSNNTTLNVGPKVLDNITITPDNPAIAKGRTQQLTATGTYSDTSTANLTGSVTWASDNISIATIDINTGLVQSLAQGHTTITATSGNISDSTVLTVTAKVLDILTLAPTNPIIDAGRTQQFTATGTYSDASTANLTCSVTWSSNNTTVARINAFGLATSYFTGTANITAASDNINASCILTVGAAVLDSLKVTPVNPGLVFNPDIPPTLQFVATAVFTDGSAITVTGSATWGSDNTSIATIGTNSGLATTVTAGTTVISATYNGKNDNTTFTVRPDTVAPVVTLTTPSGGQIFSDNSTTVAGTVDDPAATVSIIINGGAPIPAPLGASGNFTSSVTLNIGSNHILVKAVDSSGNTGTSGTITVVVNAEKPGIAITQPQDGIVTNNPSLTVTGTISGNVTSANLIFNGTTQSVSVTGGNFSANITLASGKNIITVKAYTSGHENDSNYLGSSGVRTIKLDTTAPVVTINCPTSGSVVSTPGCVISGTIDDPAVSTVNMTLNGVSQNVSVVNKIFNRTITLGPGNNTLEVVACDQIGNISSTNVTLIYDNARPVVTITAPANRLATNVTNYTVMGTINDPIINTATLYVNGIPRTISITNGSFSESIALITGVNALEVRASDNANPPNTGTSGIVNITLDATAPILAIGLNDPTDSVTITITSNEPLSSTPNVSVNATDIIMTPLDTTRWSGTYGSNGTPIATGTYTVTANATDLAGNTTTRIANFAKQTLSVSDNETATVSTSTVTLQINTTANVTNATITVTQHLDNPSGNVGNPEGVGKSAGAFVEIVVSTELQDNLEQVYIRVEYDPNELPANTDESSLKLYLWDVSSGTWQLVPDSGVNIVEHYIYGTVAHLSIYGGFGIALPPPTPPNNNSGGGGGGGGPPAGVVIIADAISPNGKLSKEKRVFSINYEVILVLPVDTYCTIDGGPIAWIYILPLEDNESPPPVPDYNVTVARIFKLGPERAQFDPPIPLTFNYKQKFVPEGIDETTLYIAWWDTQTNQWVKLHTKINPADNTALAYTSHFSMYTLMVDIRVANITASDISVSPEEIHEGQDVNISITLYNSGNMTGEYDAILKLNGVERETKKVTVAPSENVTIDFTVSGLSSGTYVIDIGDLKKSITVLPKKELTPASFEVSSLKISSKEIDVGEKVTISVTVANTGESSGNYSVTFKVNTTILVVKEITLAGHANQEVAMTTSFDTPGKKLIEVGGLLGSLEVRGEVPLPSQVPLPLEEIQPTSPSFAAPSESALPVEQGTTSGMDWTLIISVAGGCIVLAGCIFYFVYWRKRT